MPSAPASASGPRTQNATASPAPVSAPPGRFSLLGELQHDVHRTCSPTGSGTSERRARVGPCT